MKVIKSRASVSDETKFLLLLVLVFFSPQNSRTVMAREEEIL